jgi:ABC-type dipeptide/oligopeptide/nickel transport system ATPase component
MSNSSLLTEPVLSFDLRIEYPKTRIQIETGAITINRGEIVGVIGESGAGKTSLVLALLRLLNPAAARVSGSVLYGGDNLLDYSERQMRKVRGREIALLLQNPLSALNPALRLRTQYREAWRAHAPGRDGWVEPVSRVLEAAGLETNERFFALYPHELSAGIAQRALLALVLMHSPALLIADEPTSSLDVIHQAGVLELLSELNHKQGLSILMVTHDLGAAAAICDTLVVMKDGQVVECGAHEQVLSCPRHPYTQALVNALRSRLALTP